MGVSELWQAQLLPRCSRRLAVNDTFVFLDRISAVVRRRFAATLLVALAVLLATGRAEDKKPKDEAAKNESTAVTKGVATGAAEGAPIPLNKNGTVLYDIKGKRVLLKTHVALQQGSLEMLCCKKQTKEHESILSLDAMAQAVHAGLLTIGAKPGSPVRYNPEFQPPTGQK